MNWKTLKELVQQLGGKLMEAWPHILALIAILQSKAMAAADAACGSCDEFIEACVANGVSKCDAEAACAC